MLSFFAKIHTQRDAKRALVFASALACTGLVSLIALPSLVSAAPPVKSARAVATSTPPEIDGRLDDEVWRTARKIRGFTERKPTLRGVPPVDTWFAVLFDANALYIGVFNGDDDPAGIRATTTTRDSFAVFSDDALSIKLDPTHDHRTTAGFVINPAGARMDYRGVNEKDFRVEFDTVWAAKSALVEGGWSAEFAIPWRSLGIDPRQPPVSIGLNFSRDHPRRNATYDWALMPPPFSPVSASLYGHLEGLDQLATIAHLASAATVTSDGEFASDAEGFLGRHGIALIPYVLGGFSRETTTDPEINAGTDPQINAGVDVLARFGGGLRARLSINTDFAQVDVDDQVVNLSRFGLFMPEKREFFVRDVDLFSFGRSGSAQGFYSRRIGLDDGWGRVPILAGAKVVGSFDRTQVGVIDVVTARTDDSPLSGDGVVRALHRFEGGSTVGGIFTHRIRDGGGDLNLTAGADMTLRGRNQPLLVEAFALGTVDRPGARAASKSSGGGAVDLTWRGLLWRPSFGYAFFERDLKSELGFFLRTGIHQTNANLAWEPRFSGVLEKLTVSNSATSIHDQSGDLLDVVVANSSRLTWKAGWWLEGLADWRTLRAQTDFSLPDGSVVTAGSYEMLRVGVAGSTPWVRAAAIQLRLRAREYWGGTMLEALPTFVFRPGGLVRIEGGASVQKVEIDGLTSFTSVVLNTRAAIGFSPNLNLDLYAGWNRLFDVFPVQARLRWTWRRASDLFVVYQAQVSGSSFAIPQQSLLAKFTIRYP